MKIGMESTETLQSVTNTNNIANTKNNKSVDIVNSLIDSKQTKVKDKYNSTFSDKSFNNVLNKLKAVTSKASDSLKKDTKSITTNTKMLSKTTKKEEISSKIEELEEKIEKLTTEEIIQALNTIFSMMNELTKSDSLVINNENIDINEAVTSIINVDSKVEFNMMNALGQAISSTQENLTTVLANILEMMNNNGLDEFINKDNLSVAQKLLEQLNVKIQEDSSMKNTFVKELINELQAKVENLTSKVANQSNTMVKDTSVVDINLLVKEEANSSNSESNNSNSGETYTNTSKDEKVLNSILKNDNSNTFSSFTNSLNRLNNTNVINMNNVQPVDAENMVQDIVKDVKYMSTVNMKEMVVKVNPANLGEITIKLVEENGEMKLNIKSSSKETYSLLSQQLGDLHDQLKDQNIKIQDVKLSLYEEDTTFFKDGEFNNESFNNENSKQQSSTKLQNNMVNEEEDSSESEDLSNINMLA